MPHIYTMKNEGTNGMYQGPNYRTTFQGTGYTVETLNSETGRWMVDCYARSYGVLNLFRANKLARSWQGSYAVTISKHFGGLLAIK